MSAPDPHFPAVHLRPPANWVNDPNGLVFHEDHFHVYFQYNPHSARHTGMHWGHYRSRDLVHWEHLPVALTPTPGGDDADGVWSGNAVSTDGTLIAFYCALRDDRWWQPVTSAVSHDGGRTFTKRPDLLLPQPPEGTSMFRDPYVWRDGAHWRMLVGSGTTDGRGAAQQYLSTDLRHWQYAGPFLTRAPQSLDGGGDTEEGWECVQYADFGGSRGALLLSAWDPQDGAARTVAYVGRDQGTDFATGAPQRLDHGPDFYAPALLAVPREAEAPPGGALGRRWLMWAWSWEARDAARVGAPSAWTDEVGWAGMLTLPREVTLGANGSLRQRPAPELHALRGPVDLRKRGAATARTPHDLGPTSRAFDLQARLQRSADGRAAAGVRLLTSSDDTEHLDILLDPETGDLVVDRSHASGDPRAQGGAWRIPAAARPGDFAEIRVIIDHSIAEVFLLDTGEALTVRFYPQPDTAWRLRAVATGQGSAHFDVWTWPLHPISIQDLSRAGAHAAGGRTP